MLEDHTEVLLEGRLSFLLLALLGLGIGSFWPRAVALLLKVAVLLGALGIDLTLDGIGAFLLFLLRGALACARGRARRIDLCLGRSLLRTGSGLCLVGT